MMIKKTLVALSLIGILPLTPSLLNASSSLHSILTKKEDTPLVDLSGLDVSAKPKPLHPQSLQSIPSRPASSVVAIVNGVSIKKGTLDKYISKITKGKIKNFDLLPPKQKKVLVQQYYLPKYLGSLALNTIPRKDRVEIYKSIWMRKKASSFKISDKEIKAYYDKMVEQMSSRGANTIIPPFDNIKDRLKIQLLDEKMTKYVLSKVKVELSEPNPMGIVGSIDGKFLSIDDVEPLVSQLTQGKARWNTLRDADREKILEMMATKESIPKLAMREIPYDEKISAISNYYLAEHIKDIKVSDKEIKKAYKKVKSRYKKSKAPSFDKIKESLKMEIARDIYIKRLMKQIKVKLK